MTLLRRSPRLVVVALMATVCVATASAAELTDPARQAFADYSERARRAFLARVGQPLGLDAAMRESLEDGEALARPGGGDGIISAPDSLIHHWYAATFIPGVRLDQVIAVSRAYGEYPGMFRSVIRSSVLASAGDTIQVQLRVRESAGGLTATLDIRSTVAYSRVGPSRAYTVSHSDEIREVKDAGRPGEQLLPAGRDSGYLWRAAAFTRFVEADAGVYVEMETLGLSRPFPRLLGWMIEPIARRVGRRSAENSVTEFRAAVLDKHAQSTGD